MPLEMAELMAAKGVPAHAQGWLSKISALGGFDRNAPETYQVRELSPLIHVYGDPAVRPEEKCLILGFCGNSNRLLLPISCILQSLPSGQCDIVILRDRQRLHYTRGLPHFGTSLPALVRDMAAAIAPERYLRRYCFGTCSGGFPALRYGLMAKAERAISISGTFAYHPRRLLDEPELSLPAFDPLCDCGSTSGTELICAFGAHNAEDRRQAARLARILPVREIAFENISEHNVLYALARERKLSAFFRQMFELKDTAATSQDRTRAASA